MIKDDLSKFGRVRFVEFNEAEAAKLDPNTDAGDAAAKDGDDAPTTFVVPAGVAIVRFFDAEGRDAFVAAHATKPVEVNAAPLQDVRKIVCANKTKKKKNY
jgi:hypothetical protein